jgi:quinol monooxygenase YgiN
MDELPLTLVVAFRARPGREGALGDALRALVGPTRAEPGCVAYDLHRSLDDPASWFFTETWASPVAHRLHDGTPHVVAFRAAQPDLLAEPQMVLRGVLEDG